MKNHGKTDWIQKMAEDGDFRADSVLCSDSVWPTPIASYYAGLFDFMKEGRVYAAILQIRDLYEAIIKIPVLAALIYICETNKATVLSDAELLRNWIKSPMSIGHWHTLARYLSGKNGMEKYSLPASLCNALKTACTLIEIKVSDKHGYQNVMNWRNEVIGHGALQCEDSEEYQDVLHSLLESLKSYFEGKGKKFRGSEESYEQIYFTCGDTRLRGKDAVITDNDERLRLTVKDQTFTAGSFILTGMFFFSSIYRDKGKIKYLNYESGKDKSKDYSEMQEYVDAYNNTEKYLDESLSQKVVTRGEDVQLIKLLTPQIYIPPQNVIEKINDYINKESHGLILLCMERGTGKSAFTNAADTLNQGIDLLNDDTVIRSYSLGTAELRGINDFINAINIVFTHAYNPENDFRTPGIELPQIKIDDENPANTMACLLNFYRNIYEEKFNKSKLMFVLDGLDEASVNTSKILTYLPTSDCLDEGVYIVCTSRIEDKENISNMARNWIKEIREASGLCIKIERADQENQMILRDYIHKINKSLPEDKVKMLIEKSDYRMLYLKAHLSLFQEGIFDVGNENIAREYLEKLGKTYNARQKQLLKKTVARICLLGPVKLTDYFFCDELTYGFIGVLNDLQPLLSSRNSDSGREYALADEAYRAHIADAFKEEIISLMDDVKTEFVNGYLHRNDNPERPLGFETAKKEIYWILTIRKVIDFISKYAEYDFANAFFTDELVNNYIRFSHSFMINNQMSVGYIQYMVREALQTNISMLYAIASNNLRLRFDNLWCVPGYPLLLVEAEGYKDLLGTVFNKETDLDRLREWKYIFFARDFSEESNKYHPQYKVLIDHLRKENLLKSVEEMLSQDPESKYYLSYLSYLSMNASGYESNGENVYREQPPEEDVSKKAEELFWGFRLINADLSAAEYSQVKEALTSENIVVKNAACNELKKCLDLVDKIIKSSDDEDNDSILRNCLPLLPYADLVYREKTDDVIGQWIKRLEKRIRKLNIVKGTIYIISDISRYLELRTRYRRLLDILDGLYKSIIYRYGHDDSLKTKWLSEYVKNCGTQRILLELRPFIFDTVKLSKDAVLPSYESAELLDLYHRLGKKRLARMLCRQIAKGTGEFQNKIIEVIPEEEVLLSPQMWTYYHALIRYVNVSCQAGCEDIIKGIHIDFKRELSELKRFIGGADQYADLNEANEIVESILLLHNEVEIDGILDKRILPEMRETIERKIISADDETVKVLQTMKDKIEKMQHGVRL